MGNLKAVFMYLGDYQLKEEWEIYSEVLRVNKDQHEEVTGRMILYLLRNNFPAIQESCLKIKGAGLGANEFSSALKVFSFRQHDYLTPAEGIQVSLGWLIMVDNIYWALSKRLALCWCNLTPDSVERSLLFSPF